MKNILIIGAGGQIGTELVPHFQKIYGYDHVIAAEIRPEVCQRLALTSRAILLDAMDKNALAQVVKEHKINWIFNLVALLSAKGEQNPQLAWHINMTALFNSLEVAREYGCGVFTPSSIGAFGPDTPHDQTPQDTLMRPNTIYGVCKVSGELLSDYYFHRFGVDTRSVRFPGIISSGAVPGGGTTDYAVDIFYSAVRGEHFVCPLPADSYLDMIYMPDALDACSQLIEADPARLRHRNAFNIASMSFCPQDIYEAVRRRVPELTMSYEIDPVKKAIADSWPNMMDDSCARAEWDWNPRWDLERMTDHMLPALRKRLLGE